MDISRMNSIVPECNDVKHRYDDCFHNWFTTKFLHNRHGSIDPCKNLLEEYQSCTKKALKEAGIDLAEVDARIIGGDRDKAESHPGERPHAQNKKKLEYLEHTIEAVQEHARELAIIAADFMPVSQPALDNKLSVLVSGLQEMSKLRADVVDERVPIELLERLTRGENPRLYTRHVQERTMQANETLQGKQQLYDKYRAVLLGELSKSMPQATMQYRQIRERPMEMALQENESAEKLAAFMAAAAQQEASQSQQP